MDTRSGVEWSGVEWSGVEWRWGGVRVERAASGVRTVYVRTYADVENPYNYTPLGYLHDLGAWGGSFLLVE